MVWKMLTGYDSFSESGDDDRYLGTAGVTLVMAIEGSYEAVI